ncbi:hypothetical protein NK718_04630 [Alsobacter sp. SYSU M60028]|uniref:Uncharacterized protein n=1 Tax=Alsobacter ponti TaxID=2962936 RepID=A0ABT1LAK1_9HYPH|nr:hypothetical protein [Alsobacter ponti]MCP8937790.1 hypothetical protein [Alsobacter ponti]
MLHRPAGARDGEARLRRPREPAPDVETHDATDDLPDASSVIRDFVSLIGAARERSAGRRSRPPRARPA